MTSTQYSLSLCVCVCVCLCVCVQFPNVLHNFSKEQICMSNRTHGEETCCFSFYKHHTEKKRLDISFSGTVSERLCCCLDTYLFFFLLFFSPSRYSGAKLKSSTHRTKEAAGRHPQLLRRLRRSGETRKTYMFMLRIKTGSCDNALSRAHVMCVVHAGVRCMCSDRWWMSM